MVRERIRDLFIRELARALVCSAACGADLLALQVAQDLHLRRRVILPTPPERFRETSVVDREGDWGTLFDEVVRQVRGAGDLVVLPAEAESSRAGYLRVTQVILDEAVALARREASLEDQEGGQVLAVVVWDGAPRGPTDVTAAFLLAARQRGLRVAEISTL